MAKPTQGPARLEVKSLDTAVELQAGRLVLNDRRVRPRYFDGRFLAARDLKREQVYFLTRQADLAQAGGQGVVTGLTVKAGAKGQIVISSGHGVTSVGEIVVMDSDTTVDFNDLVAIERLDDAFGLAQTPSDANRGNQSGLFIIVLRPVEFTAHPISNFPTSIGGEVSLQDGDIIEAVAVTLVRYPDDGAGLDFDKRRARTARDIFVNRSTKGFPENVLPIAMIALQNGNLQWVDQFMVRREVGAETRDILNLGTPSLASREAHLSQYEAHLEDVLLRRGGDGTFAASLYFDCLPAAGRLPVAAIDTTSFSQFFFPQEMTVEMTIVPEDEVPALLQQSLYLPPIDLSASGKTLESTAVLVLIPAPRDAVLQLSLRLQTLRAPLKAAAPGLLAQRSALERLRAIAPLPVEQPVVDAQASIDAAWRKAIGNATLLFFVRQSHLQYKVDVVKGERLVLDFEGQLRFEDLNSTNF